MTTPSILFCVLALTLKVFGAESPDGLKDLGVLSPRTAIPLERNTTREDFSHFEIEVSLLRDTNRVVKFTTTNDFLDISHFRHMPSGRMLLGVKSVSLSGMESLVDLSTFSLWKSERLPSPSAHKVIYRSATNGMEGGSDSLVRAFGRLRASSTQRKLAIPPPPLPPGLTNTATVPRVPGPLPNGKPETYAQHLDSEAEERMKKFYARSGRRNQ